MKVTAAPACKAALTQATVLWPQRLRLSDGILPAAAHTIRSPTSDHELGNAFDLTHDPVHGVDCHVLAQQVIEDPRVKYVIWNRQIFNASVSPLWRAYTGSNPHTKHMHVSIHGWARDDTSPWWKPQPVAAPDIPSAPPTIVTDYPAGEDTLRRHDMHIRLDDKGNGWAILDVDAASVVSLVAHGPYPPADQGYWNLPALGRQARDGKTVVTSTEGPPGGELLVTVWTI